jgi:sugar fermentation stimulation protein A
LSFVPYGDTVNGAFVRRMNRFVAEVEVSGELATAHVPSSGRMSDILLAGAEVLLRPAPKANQRATSFTLLAVRKRDLYVSLDATLPNRLLKACFATTGLPELAGWSLERSEYSMGDSRFDFLLRRDDVLCPTEVKSVTHVDEVGSVALFPDAPTTRGTRHVRHLTAHAATGGVAAIIFVIQRSDATHFAPYTEIDPVFAEALRAARQQGVIILAYRCAVSRKGVRLSQNIPISM